MCAKNNGKASCGSYQCRHSHRGLGAGVARPTAVHRPEPVPRHDIGGIPRKQVPIGSWAVLEPQPRPRVRYSSPEIRRSKHVLDILLDATAELGHRECRLEGHEPFVAHGRLTIGYPKLLVHVGCRLVDKPRRGSAGCLDLKRIMRATAGLDGKWKNQNSTNEEWHRVFLFTWN